MRRIEIIKARVKSKDKKRYQHAAELVEEDMKMSAFIRYCCDYICNIEEKNSKRKSK